MRKQNRTLTFPNTGVSPVVGASLMLALVVLFTTIIGGVILSQYSTPDDPPEADGVFAQQVNDDTERTSNIRYTLVNSYNSDSVTIQHENDSMDLHDNTSTPYIAYKSSSSYDCNQSGKNIGNNVNVTQDGESYTNISKTYCILTPDDSEYDPNEAVTEESGDTVYICGLENEATLQVMAENDREQRVISTYTVNYQNVTQYTIGDQYDNPCSDDNS